MKQLFREQIKAAMKVENEEFSAQVHSEDAKEALRAFLEKCPPDFTRTMKSAAAGWAFPNDKMRSTAGNASPFSRDD
jgi:hypothetical protein